MAGPHQIWVIDLLHDQAYPYAGTGEEERRDGAVGEAAFAQPSGLAIDGDTLFVADAESNTIRSVALPPVESRHHRGRWQPVRLRRSGRHGRCRRACSIRSASPCTTAASSSPIPTTTRSRCSIPLSGKVTTIAGTGQPGHVDGAASRAQFYEPGGISVAGHIAYIADTNNHAIRTIDLHASTVATLTLEGLAPPAAWSYLRQR